jgi:hypothetical protein
MIEQVLEVPNLARSLVHVAARWATSLFKKNRSNDDDCTRLQSDVAEQIHDPWSESFQDPKIQPAGSPSLHILQARDLHHPADMLREHVVVNHPLGQLRPLHVVAPIDAHCAPAIQHTPCHTIAQQNNTPRHHLVIRAETLNFPIVGVEFA